MSLKQIHEMPVVQWLVPACQVKDAVASRDLASALCRLCYREADWDGRRGGAPAPIRTGPYYKNAEWDGTPAARPLSGRDHATKSLKSYGAW